jgi:hypothetical protein
VQQLSATVVRWTHWHQQQTMLFGVPDQRQEMVGLAAIAAD